MPFWLLAVAVGLVGILFGWLSVRALPWLRRGNTVHVYWPCTVAYRWVAGKPRWRPEDLMIGIQPRTDAEIATARDHEHVAIMECGCDDPNCALKNHPRFTWMIGAKQMREQAERQGAPVMDLDAMPPVIKQKFLDAARKVVGYYELAEENGKLLELIERQKVALDTSDQLLQADKELLAANERVIRSDADLIEQLKALTRDQEAELEKRDRDLDELRVKYAEIEKTVDRFRATALAN